MKPSYKKAGLFIFIGVIVVLTAMTISGGDLLPFTRVCQRETSLCAGLANTGRALFGDVPTNAKQWVVSGLDQINPSLGNRVETSLADVLAMLGLSVLGLGMFMLIMAVSRSFRNYRSVDRSPRAKREMRLRMFFDPPATRFRSGFFWLVITVGGVSLLGWLRTVDASRELCGQMNWLCQGRYTSTVIFVIVIITGVVAAYRLLPSLRLWRTIPSSDQVKEWKKESAERLQTESSEALHLLDTHRRPKPEIIMLPVLPEEFEYEDPMPTTVPPEDIVWRSVRRLGHDVEVFFGAYLVTIIQFDVERFALYTCDYSFISDLAFNEQTYESQYANITALSMISQMSVSMPGTGMKIKLGEVLRLSLSNGDSFLLRLPASEGIQKVNPAGLAYTDGERVLNVLRTKIRNTN